MIIKKAKIIGYGKLINKTFEFGNHLNLVYGNNEAGKSTLQTFLKSMLYGVRTNKSLRTKYSPWDGEAYKGILECIDSKGNEYRIERDFKKSKTNIFNSELVDITAEFIPTTSKHVHFAEKIIDMNEDEFEKIVFINQFDTKVDKNGKKNILSKFANVETSGDEDISIDSAIKRLSSIWKTKIGTKQSTTQPINILERKIVKKKEDIQRIENTRIQLQEKELLLKENKGQDMLFKDKINKFKEIEKWISKEEIAVNKKQKVDKLILLKEKLKKKEEELTENKDYIAKEEENIKSYADYSELNKGDLFDLNTAFDNYTSYDEEIKSVEKKIVETDTNIKGVKEELDEYAKIKEIEDEIQEEVNKLKYQENKKERNNKKLFLLFWIISAIFVIGSIALAIIFNPLLYILTGVSTISLITFILLWIKEGKASSNSENKIEKLLEKVNIKSLEEFDEKKDKFNSLEKEIEALSHYNVKNKEDQEKYIGIKQEQKNVINKILVITDINENNWLNNTNILDQFINEYDSYCNTLNTIETYKGKADSVTKEIEGVLNQIEDYTDTSEISLEKSFDIIDELIKEKENVQFESNSLKEELAEKEIILEYIGDNISDYKDKISEHLKEYKMKQRTAELEITKLETEIKTILGENSDIHKNREEMYLLEQQKEQMLINSTSLEMAINYIKESAQEVQKDFVPKLNSKMSKYISHITEGKYNELKVDKELTIRLIDSSSSKVVETQNLSGGTLLQIYLALRLSVTELVEKDKEKVPLFLDEIFGSYDNSRIEGTLNIMKKIIKDRQIFIFTCKESEKEQIEKEFNSKIKIIEL